MIERTACAGLGSSVVGPARGPRSAQDVSEVWSSLPGQGPETKRRCAEAHVRHEGKVVYIPSDSLLPSVKGVFW